MGWATKYIEQLSRGEAVQFRPRGNSMSGKIESGQLVTVDVQLFKRLPANYDSLRRNPGA